MSIDPAHLNLRIDVDSDPITGSVSVGRGEPRSFSGWMDLVEAIEDARHPRAERSAHAGEAGPKRAR